MDRYRIAANFNAFPSQRPNLTPIIAPSQISLHPKPHLDGPHIFPYLRPEPAKLAGDGLGHTTDDTEISIFEAERYFNESQDFNLTTKKLTVALNSVTQSCNLSTKPADYSVSSLEGFSQNFRNRSFRASPTASSDAIWNSEAGLLRKSQASLSVSVTNFPNGEQRKKPSSSARRLFGCSCPCSGKKSIDVEEKYSEPKNSNLSRYATNNCSVTGTPKLEAEEVNKKEGVEQMAKMKIFPGIMPHDPEIFRAPGRFSLEKPFPAPEIGLRIVDSGLLSFPSLTQRKENAAEDPARVSLEVFRPIETATTLRKSVEFQKNPFSINTIVSRSFNFPGISKLPTALDDDVASDTSSDLFEIDSLSTQMGFRRRDSLDELSSSLFGQRKLARSAAGVTQLRRGVENDEAATPSIAPSECYPPSEVSVEWSVTTAEGFDRSSAANFSSAVSEYEELRYAAGPLGGGKKKGLGGGGGGLLSCRSDKAVCVAGPKSAWFGPETQRRVENPVSLAGLDRIMGVARLGEANPIHDSSGTIGLRNRSRFA